MRHTKARGDIVTFFLLVLSSVTGCGHDAARTDKVEADKVEAVRVEAGNSPAFEPFRCEIVDANSGELIPGRELTIQFMFKKPATEDSPEEIVSNVIWGSKSPAQIEFVVPEEVMRRPDRGNLVIQWGVSHPDYETLAPQETVRLDQILLDDPKSARDTFRRIKLSKRTGSPA